MTLPDVTISCPAAELYQKHTLRDRCKNTLFSTLTTVCARASRQQGARNARARPQLTRRNFISCFKDESCSQNGNSPPALCFESAE